MFNLQIIQPCLKKKNQMEQNRKADRLRLSLHITEKQIKPTERSTVSPPTQSSPC